jgi:hypothetical protein
MEDRFAANAAAAPTLPSEGLKGASLVALVIANLFPIYGVLFLRWDAFDIVLLYWAENLVIGFYNILKIAFVRVNRPVDNLGKLLSIPFFIVHFGGFCAVHGLFIFFLFGKDRGFGALPSSNAWPCFLVFVQLLIGVLIHAWYAITAAMKWGIAALFVSHGVSFVQNYILKGEYLAAAAQRPLWYISDGPNTVASCTTMMHPGYTWQLFQAQAYILRRPADQLKMYLEVPLVRADLYYIENLAAVLAASSKQSWRAIP